MKSEVKGKMIVIFLIFLLVFGFGSRIIKIFSISKDVWISRKTSLSNLHFILFLILIIRFTKYFYNIKFLNLGNNQVDNNFFIPSNLIGTKNSSNITPNLIYNWISK